MEDLIIIIPSHKRQNYLKRVSWYYSRFECPVYICDSTPEIPAQLKPNENIHYIHCPGYGFCEKILHVLENTEAKYYALSPDDDFLKKETLNECYKQMKSNLQYSMGTGREILFLDKFDDKLYKVANKFKWDCFPSDLSHKDFIDFFADHYQNILWSLYRKDVIVSAFRCLNTCRFNNNNFIELVLAIESLKGGDYYVSKEGMNYRELTTKVHWGKTQQTVTLATKKTEDYRIFCDYYSGEEFPIHFLERYMKANTAYYSPFLIVRFFKRMYLRFIYIFKQLNHNKGYNSSAIDCEVELVVTEDNMHNIIRESLSQMSERYEKKS